MKYKVITEGEVGESWRLTIVTATYSHLVQLFGKPEDGEDRIQAQWALTDEDGNVLNLYDYREEVPKEMVTEWHIGGTNSEAGEKLKTRIEINEVLLQISDLENKLHELVKTTDEEWQKAVKYMDDGDWPDDFMYGGLEIDALTVSFRDEPMEENNDKEEA